MTSPAEHAATVRDLDELGITREGNAALDALVALAARADELEREVSVLRHTESAQLTERDVLLADAKDALECRLYAGHMPLGTKCNYPEEPMCDRCALLARIEELEGSGCHKPGLS